MSLKRASLLAMARIINEVAYESQDPAWNGACARIALKMAEYFEQQNRFVNTKDFLAACAVEGAGDAGKIRGDEGRVQGQGEIGRIGENAGGENLQLAAEAGPEASDP